MLTENATVKEVAEKLGATPAQVLVAWGTYRGYSVIPKSVQESQYNSCRGCHKHNGLTDSCRPNHLELQAGCTQRRGLRKSYCDWSGQIRTVRYLFPYLLFYLFLPISFNIPVRFKPKWNINLFNEELEKVATYQVNIAY